MSKVTLAILTIFCLASCKNKPPKVSVPVATLAPKTNTSDSIAELNKVKASDFAFLKDSVLPGHETIPKYYFNEYSQYWHLEDRQEIKETFDGLYYIGKIKNSHRRDSVFVIRGGYYFTDTTLPSLHTDSYCCHPSNLFLVGDINEDGISEIGEYYSTCVSHYKTLNIYTLKNKNWKEIGHCVYDLDYMDIGKPYSYFVRKTGKNKFKMLEIADLTEDKTKIGKRNWIPFSM